jgi:hypothetical protein
MVDKKIPGKRPVLFMLALGERKDIQEFHAYYP